MEVIDNTKIERIMKQSKNYEWNRNYYLKHRDELLERSRQYRLDHLETYNRQSNIRGRYAYYKKKGLLNGLSRNIAIRIVEYIHDNNLCIKNIEDVKQQFLNHEL